MKLEEQVISLEKSLILVKLGFDRDGLFEYNSYIDESNELKSYIRRRQDNINLIPVISLTHTYTVSELMDIINENGIEICVINQVEGYIAYEIDIDSDGLDNLFKGTNLAEVLGDMLIYLIKVGHIKI